MAPKISAIMSVYNGESYLKEAVNSVIEQNFKDWELIIINDCSTDKTEEILEELQKKDKRIKVIKNEVNLRLPTSLNKAIDEVSGKYILRMDADDICLPKRFELQYKFMEENTDIDFSSIRFFTLKNGVYAPGGCGGRCDSDAIGAMLLVTNPILHPGVIAKAEVMKELKYDTTLTCTEDLELWTRAVMNNKKFAILPEYLLLYRLHDKQITATTLEKQHKEVLKVEEKYYRMINAALSEDKKDFYISGIYFKENADVSKLWDFYKYVKSENKREKKYSDDAVNYAFFEMLAEYKRIGVSKKDILRTILKFNLFFVLKETVRRKKAAARDLKSLNNTAKEIGLNKTAGTKAFPIFSKDDRG